VYYPGMVRVVVTEWGRKFFSSVTTSGLKESPTMPAKASRPWAEGCLPGSLRLGGPRSGSVSPGKAASEHGCASGSSARNSLPPRSA